MKLILFLLPLLLLTACKGLPKADYSNASNALSSTSSSTSVIRDNAKDIAELAPEVKPQTQVIIKEADKIDTATTTVAIELKAAKKETEKLTKDLANAKEESSKWLNRAISITIFASGLAVAVSIGLFIFGHLKSLLATLVAVCIFVAAITMQVLLAYMVYVALGTGILLAGVILYFVYKNRQAQKELVQTVEDIKPTIDNSVLKTVGDKVQTPFTKAVVDKLQGK